MIELIKVKPMFNAIITTMNVYDRDQYNGSLIDTSKTKGAIKEYQTVVAVGNAVRDIKVGDVVAIDPTRYTVVQHADKNLANNIKGDELKVGYKFKTIKLDGVEHLMLFDQDISYIIEESREVKNTGPVIIQPEKPKIII